MEYSGYALQQLLSGEFKDDAGREYDLIDIVRGEE